MFLYFKKPHYLYSIQDYIHTSTAHIYSIFGISSYVHCLVLFQQHCLEIKDNENNIEVNVDTRSLFWLLLDTFDFCNASLESQKQNDYITITHHSTILRNIYFRIISFIFSFLLLPDYGSKRIKFQVIIRCKVYIHTFIKRLIR